MEVGFKTESPPVVQELGKLRNLLFDSTNLFLNAEWWPALPPTSWLPKVKTMYSGLSHNVHVYDVAY